jgi:hypothetical protein
MNFKIRELSLEWRVLICAFTLSLLIGYGVALLKAFEKTSFSPSRVTVSYRGENDPDSLELPKTFEEILQNTHAHAMSVPLVYFLLGGLFCGTSASARLKIFSVIFIFGGFFIEYLSLWGLLYVHKNFVWGTFAAHAVSGLAYLSMTARVLWDCRRAQ